MGMENKQHSGNSSFFIKDTYNLDFGEWVSLENSFSCTLQVLETMDIYYAVPSGQVNINIITCVLMLLIIQQ